MKVGDLVRQLDELVIQQTWTIVALRSDARGIWVQFDETPHDTWHAANAYEVISESR
jgi:hypothetical protein